MGAYMKITKEVLGARIKEMRKFCGLSQQQLAEKIGVEPRHMSRIEVGKNYPTIDRLEKIAEALNVPLKDFFDFMHLDSPDTRALKIDELMKSMN
jgi:transcriptional regulator with XRE-family HTH domain